MVDKSLKNIHITTNNKTVYGYEIFISILALIAVATSIIESNDSIIRAINGIVLTIFVLDYIVRLAISQNKRDFFKENILDLIAIFPFNSFFRVLRVAKLIKIIKLTKTMRVFRVFSFSKKFHINIKKFLKTNGFIYMVYITIAIILLAATLLYIIEKDNVISTFEDAVWLSFSTTTLFGYEGVENLTIAGKIISGILILSGIFFTGMFTATTLTYFNNRKKEAKDKTTNKKIVDLSDLNNSQYNEVLNYIDYVRTKQMKQYL